MNNPVADIFNQAADLLKSDPARNNNVLNLGDPGEVIIAGDIHGNRPNLQKIITYSSKISPAPTLILQELIHGPVDEKTGQDRSIEILLRAARLKIKNPEKVHFLMGNHDLAQFSGNEIAKEGRGVCKGFVTGVEFCFGEEAAAQIVPAANKFMQAMPIAAKFDNGLWASHTLPSPNRQEVAGYEIFTRNDYAPQDYKRSGSLYEWTWGRDQTPDQLDAIAEKLGVEFFVIGHRHIQEGLLEIPNRAIAINSDKSAGCIFQFNSSQAVNFENYQSHIKPLYRL